MARRTKRACGPWLVKMVVNPPGNRRRPTSQSEVAFFLASRSEHPAVDPLQLDGAESRRRKIAQDTSGFRRAVIRSRAKASGGEQDRASWRLAGSRDFQSRSSG